MKNRNVIYIRVETQCTSYNYNPSGTKGALLYGEICTFILFGRYRMNSRQGYTMCTQSTLSIHLSSSYFPFYVFISLECMGKTPIPTGWKEIYLHPR